MDLLLGIDIGTGSTKGVLVDACGSRHCVESPRALDGVCRGLAGPRWTPRRLWWREVCAISATLMAQVPDGSALAAMCVSGVGPCLVLCDADLTPVAPGNPLRHRHPRDR